jgi:hypothetical protein
MRGARKRLEMHTNILIENLKKTDRLPDLTQREVLKFMLKEL